MRRLLPVIVLAFGTGVAQADNGLFYFGVGVTRNNADTSAVGGAFDTGMANYFPNINSTSWDVFAGFRPISLFAVEADYFDLGSGVNDTFTPGLAYECSEYGGPCVQDYHSDAKAYGGYAVGFLPIPVPNLDVYGKVGVARYDLHGSLSSGGGNLPITTTSYSDDSTVFAWGVGVQAHIGIIGARLEYAGFDKASTSVFSLSVFLNL